MFKTCPRLETLFILALLASVFSLAAAFTAEYGFGLRPCHLCLLQRIPYALVVVIALLGLWKPSQGVWLMAIIGVAFLAGAGIASYHTAVEKHWVEGPSGCTNGEQKAARTLDDFLKRIEQAPVILCDEPQWEYHGFTMASLNAIWSLGLAAGIFIALQQLRYGKKDDA